MRAAEERVPAAVLELVREERRDEGERRHEPGVPGADRDGAGADDAGSRRHRGVAEDRDGEPEADAAEGERDRDEALLVRGASASATSPAASRTAPRSRVQPG